MNSELERQFTSIRRALKVCSILLVVLAFTQLLSAVTSLGRMETVWDEMMGGAKKPWVFVVSSYFGTYFGFFALAMLGIFVGCILITRRSSGGSFLYLNIGIYLTVAMLNSIFVGAAQEAIRIPLEMIANPR